MLFQEAHQGLCTSHLWLCGTIDIDYVAEYILRECSSDL